MFALTLPYRLPNFCSAIRATLGQRQICQSPGLALNAHSGNEWGKIPVLTGKRLVIVLADILHLSSRRDGYALTEHFCSSPQLRTTSARRMFSRNILQAISHRLGRHSSFLFEAQRISADRTFLFIFAIENYFDSENVFTEHFT